MPGHSATLDAHPTLAQLAGFVAGRLTGDAAAAIESHLESCDACGRALEQVSVGGDSFVAGLRELSPASSSSDEQRAILDAFDAAWRSGDKPELAAVWQNSPNQDDVQLLARLISLDMSHRYSTGETVRVEDYLQAFSELEDEANRSLLLALIDNERFLREPHEPELAFAEYAQRFPKFASELEKRWERAPLRPWKKLPLRLSCPNCNAPIQVAADEAEHFATCPLCDEAFEINLDRTASWSPDELPQLGKFQLLEKLGHGAYGAVYKARDIETDRFVAVKIPRSGLILDDGDSNRFLREGRAAAQLDHPAIVPIYEVGRTDDFPYIVSRFVEGMTLRDMLIQRRFAFGQSAVLVLQLAEALEHAHQRGVVHRDIKPGNVMLERRLEAAVEASKLIGKDDQETVAISAGSTESGSSSDSGSASKRRHARHLPYQAQLLDFGLARRDEGEVTLTAQGAKVGTPQYWSPEQASGESHTLDGRSDIFSLGIIFYELLTGERPFRGTRQALEFAIRYEEPRAPRKLNPRVPKDLETICLKCLRKEPHKRYTAMELADDLRRYLGGTPILARPVTRLQRTWMLCKRHPSVTGLTLALFVSISFALTVSVLLWRQTNEELSNTAQQKSQIEIEYNRAQANLARASEAIRQNFVTITQSPEMLGNAPATLALRQKLLQEARTQCADLISGNNALQLLATDLAEFHLLYAQITLSLTEWEEAIEAAYAAISHAEIDGKSPRDKLLIAKSRLLISQALARSGEAQRAIETAQLGLSEIGANVDPRTADGRALLLTAADLHRQKGVAFLLQQEVRNAEQSFQNGGAVLERRLLAINADDAEAQFARADTFVMQADVHLRRDENGLAIADLQSSTQILDSLVRINPSVSKYHALLGDCNSAMCTLHLRLDQVDEALAAISEAITVRRRLSIDNPGASLFKIRYAQSLVQHADVLDTLGRRAEAQQDYLEAIRLQTEVVDVGGRAPQFLGERGAAQLNLGVSYQDDGQSVRALESYAAAVADLQEALIEKRALNYADTLALAYQNKALLLRNLEEYDEAISESQKAVELLDPLLENDRQLTFIARIVADNAGTAATLLAEQADDPGSVLAWASRATSALQLVREQTPNDEDARALMVGMQSLRAEILDAQNRRIAAVAAWDLAIEDANAFERIVCVASRLASWKQAQESKQAQLNAESDAEMLERYLQVCVSAHRAAFLAADDKWMPSSQRSSEIIDAILAELEGLRESGFFASQAARDLVRSDPDLASLAADARYEEFLDALD